MAIKPTIYKLTVSLSDLNRQIYDSLCLTIARHPSETMERMAVRILAFCLNARKELVFSKGRSDTEEPDIWAHSLDGNLELWIDVGASCWGHRKDSLATLRLEPRFDFRLRICCLCIHLRLQQLRISLLRRR